MHSLVLFFGLALFQVLSVPIPRPVAIVTGGSRGIGAGIACALAEAGFDLLLTFNTNEKIANEFAATLDCRVECVGGDITLEETRDKIFDKLDANFPDQPLRAMIHNAGQYVGVTASNTQGLKAERRYIFGDGSLVNENGKVDFNTMRYYQRMYGEAFIDLCERSILRMREGGSLVGIGSPGGVSQYYKPGPMYSMPGSGKIVMEFSMKIFALEVASSNINVNLVIPGITATESWDLLAKKMGTTMKQVMKDGAEKRTPMKTTLLPRDIGSVVAFLCSDAGRFITGTIVPVDGGLHLNPP